MERQFSFGAVVLAAGLLALGPATAGFFVGRSISGFKTAGRFVTVKGLAEREEKADLGTWIILFKASSNNLDEANQKIAKQKEQVMGFLAKKGFAESEYELSSLRVVDLLAREYGPEHVPPNRYIIEAKVTVKTLKVDQLEQTVRQVDELLKQGVVVEDAGYDSNPAFMVTKLNQIRPQMLKEATQSARQLAQQFAQDSGAKVGAIKQANQGTFQILNPDLGESGNTNDMRSVKKKIRVVSTVDFYLVD